MSRQPPTHGYAVSQQHTSPSSDTYSYNSRPSRSVVDRLSSGQQQGYGAPLPVTADDWERANELQHPAYRQPRPSVYSLYPGGYAAQQHSQSQPEAMHPRLRQDVVDPAAQAAWRRHRQQQQQWQQQQWQQQREREALEAGARTPLPVGAVSVVKEVVVETQPAPVEAQSPMEPQRSASVVALYQSSEMAETQRLTAIGAAAALEPVPAVVEDQAPAASSPKITAQSILTFPQVTRRPSNGSILPELALDVVDQNRVEQAPAPKRRTSFRASIGRTTSRLKAALSIGVERPAPELEPEPEPSIDELMLKWKALVSKREEQEANMEGAYDPFQDMIEDAMDLKYKELRGGGRFLIYEEAAELPAKVPIELPVMEEKPAVSKEEGKTWMAHSEKEDEISEFCDPYTGSAQRPSSPSESSGVSGELIYFPKPRTYDPPPPPPTDCRCATPCTTRCRDPFRQEAEPDTDEAVVEHCVKEQYDWEPSPTDGGWEAKVELDVEVDDTGSPTSSPPRPRESRIPRVASRASSVRRTRAQPAEVPKAPAPAKGRKDSAFVPGAAQSTQSRDRYPKYRQMSSKK